MTDDFDKDREFKLRHIFGRLTPGERSTFEAAAAQVPADQPTMLATIAGSNNDLFCSEMTGLGWLNSAQPLEAAVASRVFSINPDHRQQIMAFLAEEARRESIVKLSNEMRGKIPPMLIDAIHNADGTPFDLALILATIVEGTMRRAIKPHLHDEFLREFAKLSESMRSN